MIAVDFSIKSMGLRLLGPREYFLFETPEGRGHLFLIYNQWFKWISNQKQKWSLHKTKTESIGKKRKLVSNVVIFESFWGFCSYPLRCLPPPLCSRWAHKMFLNPGCPRQQCTHISGVLGQSLRPWHRVVEPSGAEILFSTSSSLVIWDQHL